MQNQKQQPRSGKVVAWVVLSLGVIVGVVAINLDGGRLLEERRRIQAAADAAGLAAGGELYRQYWTSHGKDPKGRAAAAAIASAQANGLSVEEVTVNIPPKEGAFAGQAGYVEVNIEAKIPATFGKIFTREDLVVRTRSVARGLPMRLGVIAMKSTGSGTFRNNSPAFTLLNAPLIVNSKEADAFRQESFGVFIASRADIAGGYVNPGGALMLGRIRTKVRPTLDPLAFLPVPSSGGVVRSAAPLKINTPIPTILRPGVYQGGISISGASVVTMFPGVYIMEGGGFSVADLASVVGLEVTIYNTTGTSAVGPISITSLGRVVLAAPLSGTYQGINFFQNRSLTTPVALTGGGLSAITGVVYALRAPAQLTGLAAVGVDILGGAYVVDTLTVQGVGAVQIDLKLNPPRIPDVRQVE